MKAGDQGDHGGAGPLRHLIDEMHTIVGAGAAEGAVDAGNMLKLRASRAGRTARGRRHHLDEYPQAHREGPGARAALQAGALGPPSVEDTIAILRGLKDATKSTTACASRTTRSFAAAKLSDRYIGGRFLPDKAIEPGRRGGERLRIEIDSMPQEIDEFDAASSSSRSKSRALAKEKDRSPIERREAIEAELSEAAREEQRHEARWQRRRTRSRRSGAQGEIRLAQERGRARHPHRRSPARRRDSSTARSRGCTRRSARPSGRLGRAPGPGQVPQGGGRRRGHRDRGVGVDGQSR